MQACVRRRWPACPPLAISHGTLLQVEVGSADEALALLRRGSRQRQRGETALNYSSSRSHSIFTVRRVVNERVHAMQCILHANIISIFLGEGR